MKRIATLCLTLLFTPLLLAKESHDLAQESEDPTAPLPTITLKNDYTPEFWHRPGNRQTYALTIVNPFKAWDRPNILGVNLPYDTGRGISSGAGSPQILDLVVFDHSQGRYGVGIAASLGPPGVRNQSLRYGPALGFVKVVDRCNLGLLNLNYFNDDVSLGALQIIAGCSMGNNWSVSSGNFLVTYNWRTGRLIEFPLSVQVAKVINLLDQPIKVSLNPRYNIEDTVGTGQWTITLALTLIADPLKVVQ